MVTFLEFALVENLNGDNGGVLDVAGIEEREVMMGMNGLEGTWKGLHIEAFIPIGIQGLSDDTGGVGLLCIHCDNGERVWETKYFALG